MLRPLAFPLLTFVLTVLVYSHLFSLSRGSAPTPPKSPSALGNVLQKEEHESQQLSQSSSSRKASAKPRIVVRRRRRGRRRC